MSFAGNLEDLAIVDVIQLLHTTRKSGTLCVTSDKGRNQIVFNKGFIVSANHYNGSTRIGKILVEMEAISEEILQQSLAEQKVAGEQRKPLIGMLIEKRVLEKDVAYKGLECLIEMTIVEMVSWQRGTFTLDVDTIEINDEYKYIPEKLQQELTFDTQMVLLDALRIYDEKQAGKITSADNPHPTEGVRKTPPAATDTGSETSHDLSLSADMLGLDTMDQIDVQVPEFFSSLEAFDPSELHRQKVRDSLPDFPSSQRELLVEFLTAKTNILDHHENITQELSQAIIYYGTDDLVQHGLMSTCKFDGIMVFTASSPQELENRITQSLDRSFTPVLVFDCPLPALDGFTKENLTEIRQHIATQFPLLQTVQLASPTDYIYSLKALTSGATTIIPRSMAENRRDSFILDFIQFLESFPTFILGLCKKQSSISLENQLSVLREKHSAAEIAYFLLEETSHFFDRCLTLVLRKDELYADKSFGIEADTQEGPSKPLGFKVPIDKEGLLAKVISSGEPFHASIDDKTIRESIFGEISAPDKSKILLLPLVVSGKTVALIYADFGQAKNKIIDLDYLKNMAWLAGMALDQVIRKNQTSK